MNYFILPFVLLVSTILLPFSSTGIVQAEPAAVAVLDDLGHVLRVSFDNGEVEARRSIEESRYTPHIYADSHAGTWLCLEGGMEFGGAALLFLDPVSLQPLEKWYPPIDETECRPRTDTTAYSGTVVVPPGGDRLYYQSVNPVYGRLFEIDPGNRAMVRSLGRFHVLPHSLYMSNGHANILVRPLPAEAVDYRMYVFDTSEDEMGGMIHGPAAYAEMPPQAVVGNPSGKGFLAVTLNKAAEPGKDRPVALIQVVPESEVSEVIINDLRESIPDLGEFRASDRSHFLFTPDGNYLVCRSHPDRIYIMNLITKDVKDVPFTNYGGRSGWSFADKRGPFMFPANNKMIHALVQDYRRGSSRSSPGWSIEQTTAVDLLVIDIPSGTIQQVIHIPNCAGLRDLAFLGKTE